MAGRIEIVRGDNGGYILRAEPGTESFDAFSNAADLIAGLAGRLGVEIAAPAAAPSVEDRREAVLALSSLPVSSLHEVGLYAVKTQSVVEAERAEAEGPEEVVEATDGESAPELEDGPEAEGPAVTKPRYVTAAERTAETVFDLIRSRGGDREWVRVPYTEMESVLKVNVSTIVSGVKRCLNEGRIMRRQVTANDGTGLAVGNWFTISKTEGGTARDWREHVAASDGAAGSGAPAAPPAASPLPVRPTVRPPVRAKTDDGAVVDPVHADKVLDTLCLLAHRMSSNCFECSLTGLSRVAAVPLPAVPTILAWLAGKHGIEAKPPGRPGGNHVFRIPQGLL